MFALTRACFLERAAWGLLECAGSSQPERLPESCPGWPLLGCCQAPSSTRSSRWVGPFRGRRGLPDTRPHGDSGAGLWGVLGPGQVNHHGRSWRGVGLFAVGCVCLCLSLCVCLGLVSSQGSLPSTSAYTSCFSLTATRLGGCLPSLGPSIPRPSPVDVWSSAAFMPLACAFKHFHKEPLVSIHHSALEAFRCHKQDLNPTGRQVPVPPSSLTPWVGGSQELLN